MTHSPSSEPASAADPIIDQRTFWRAVGNRACGSTVVTARSVDGPAGFLGLSATHVCADPPLMLVSVDRRTSALQTIVAARHFALNFLPREAAAVADMFGGKAPQKGTERFAVGRWEPSRPARRSCSMQSVPSTAAWRRPSSVTASSSPSAGSSR
jgi:flavin reductase (DIM6/NTAB) family NADH-FMN oxidoreductase RutF